MPAAVRDIPPAAPLVGPTLRPSVAPRVEGAAGGRRRAGTPTLGLAAAVVDEALPLAVLEPLTGRLVDAARVAPGLETAAPRVPLVFLLVGTNPAALAPAAPALGGFIADRARGFDTDLFAMGIAGDEGVFRLLAFRPEASGLRGALVAGDEARRGNLVVGAGSYIVSVDLIVDTRGYQRGSPDSLPCCR